MFHEFWQGEYVMFSKIRIFFSMVAIAAMVSAATLAPADDIKSRMLKRLPEIQALKDNGVIGEGRYGFLHFRKAAPDKKALVAAENADRREVYKQIAAEQGVSVEVVGQHRARQIAQRAKSGEWLQDANGNWYKK
jgi:uncharacterized protein YdbL (DUF1318 family)